MGKIKEAALAVQNKTQRGRPDLLAKIYEGLEDADRQELVEALNSVDISANILARVIINSGLSEYASQLSEHQLSVAIRRYRHGQSRFSQRVAEEVAS